MASADLTATASARGKAATKRLQPGGAACLRPRGNAHELPVARLADGPAYRLEGRHTPAATQRGRIRPASPPCGGGRAGPRCGGALDAVPYWACSGGQGKGGEVMSGVGEADEGSEATRPVRFVRYIQPATAPYHQVSRVHPLRDQLVQQITDSIRAGRFRPGQRLPTERDLGLQFGVSRSVVRDALRVLEAAGVLGIEHGRGIFVAERSGSALGTFLAAPFLTPMDLRHLFELRRALETAGAGLAALRATPLERGKLLAQAEATLLIPDDDLDAFGEADQDFHLRLHGATHNPVFMQVMENLLDALVASRSASLRVPGRPHMSMTEHVRVAQRIAQCDPDAARVAMAWHLLSVEEAVVEPTGDVRDFLRFRGGVERPLMGPTGEAAADRVAVATAIEARSRPPGIRGEGPGELVSRATRSGSWQPGTEGAIGRCV